MIGRLSLAASLALVLAMLCFVLSSADGRSGLRMPPANKIRYKISTLKRREESGEENVIRNEMFTAWTAYGDLSTVANDKEREEELDLKQSEDAVSMYVKELLRAWLKLKPRTPDEIGSVLHMAVQCTSYHRTMEVELFAKNTEPEGTYKAWHELAISDFRRSTTDVLFHHFVDTLVVDHDDTCADILTYEQNYWNIFEYASYTGMDSIALRLLQVADACPDLGLDLFTEYGPVYIAALNSDLEMIGTLVSQSAKYFNTRPSVDVLHSAGHLSDAEADLVREWAIYESWSPPKEAEVTFGGARKDKASEARDTGGWAECKYGKKRIEKILSHFPESCPFPEVDATDVDAIEEHVLHKTPFIVRNIANHVYKDVFTRQAFFKEFGQSQVFSHKIPFESRYIGATDPDNVMTLQDYDYYLDEVCTDGDEDAVKVPQYVFTPQLIHDKVALMEHANVYDVSFWPALQQVWSKHRSTLQFSIDQLGVGPAGSGSPFHYHDNAYNFNMYGEKHWFYVPPGERFVSSTPSLDFLEIWADHESSSRDLPHMFHCTQYDSDFFFAPAGWGHMTLSVNRESIGIALQTGPRNY